MQARKRLGLSKDDRFNLFRTGNLERGRCSLKRSTGSNHIVNQDNVRVLNSIRLADTKRVFDLRVALFTVAADLTLMTDAQEQGDIPQAGFSGGDLGN